MKVNKTELKAALSALSKIVPRNATLPIVECVLFKDGNLTGTDLGITITLRGVVPEHEEFLVNLHDLVAVINNATHEDITLTRSDKSLLISFAKSKLRLPLEDVEAYPTVPARKGKGQPVHSDTFGHLIGRLPGFCITDDLRPAIRGVYVNGNHAVATNTHILGLAELGGQEWPDYVVLPTKACAAIGYGECEQPAVIGENWLTWGMVDVVFQDITQGIRYPDYRAVFPQEADLFDVRLYRDELVAALKVANVSANKTTYQAQLAISGLIMGVSAEDINFNRESDTEVQLLGNQLTGPFTIAFNGKYLLDIISGLPDMELTIRLSAPHRPAVIEHTGGRTLLMPVMINSY